MNVVGGFVGKVEGSTLSGGNSTTNCTVDGGTEVGGFAGRVQNSIIANCRADAAVLGVNYVGGFVGHTYCTNNQSSFFRHSKSKGTVEGVDDVGGFVGVSASDNCGQTPNRYQENVAISTVKAERTTVGGFLGRGAGNFTKCAAMGEVQANAIGGGFAGAPQQFTFTNCFAFNQITDISSSGNSSIGGFVATTSDTGGKSISKSYAFGIMQGGSSQYSFANSLATGTSIASTYYNPYGCMNSCSAVPGTLPSGLSSLTINTASTPYEITTTIDGFDTKMTCTHSGSMRPGDYKILIPSSITDLVSDVCN